MCMEKEFFRLFLPIKYFFRLFLPIKYGISTYVGTITLFIQLLIYIFRYGTSLSYCNQILLNIHKIIPTNISYFLIKVPGMLLFKLSKKINRATSLITFIYIFPSFGRGLHVRNLKYFTYRRSC